MPADSHGNEGWQAWIPLGIHAVSVQASAFAIRPAVAYAALDAGVPVAMLGLLSASYALAPLLLAIPSGRAVDRFGERPLLVLGGVLLAASCAVLLTGSHAVGWLLTGLMLAGVAHLLCMIGEQTAVATMSRGSSDNRFAAYTFASSLGQAVGPLFLTLGDGTAAGNVPVLLSALGLSLLALLTSFFIGARRMRSVGRRPGKARDLLRDGRMRQAVIASGIVMASVDITVIYLPALGREVGFSAAFVGWVLAVRAMSSMAVRPVTGLAVRLLGRHWLLCIGMMSSAAALGAVSVWHEHAVVMVAAVILGAGLGVGQPITMAMVTDAAPDGQRGTAITLRLLGNRLSVVCVPGAVGAVAASAGPAGVLVATAGLLFLGSVLSAWRRR